MNDLLSHPVGMKLPLTNLQPSVATAASATPSVSFRDVATDRQKQSREDSALQAAQGLVASTLVQPVLDRMIDDPFRSELFHGGEGEKMFQRQANGYLAKNIVQGANFPVVQSVYRKLLSPHPTGGTLNQVA